MTRLHNRRCNGKIVLLAVLQAVLMVTSGMAQAAISFRSSAQNGIASVPAGGVVYVGTGTADSQNGCGSITPSTPGGSNGDILIALVIAKESSTSIAFPAGWNAYFAGTYPGNPPNNNQMQRFIYWRIADGTANDSFTVTQSGNCSNIGGQIARFSGVDQANPFETVAGGVVDQSSNNLDTGTITTTSPNAMLLVAGFISNNRIVFAGGGWSQSFNFESNPGGAKPDFGLSLHYQLQTTAGSKGGTLNWPLSGGGSDENTGVVFALSPDPTPPGLTIAVPAGTAANDVMVAVVAARPSTITITPPSGWTLLNAVNQAAGNSNSQAVYYRVATASEPVDYTWTFSGAITGAVGGITSYIGVDTANPVDIYGGNVTPNGTTHTANGITTTAANAMLVSSHSFSSAETWTPPAGMTERVDAASVAAPQAGGISLEMNDVMQAAAGATGNKAATAAGNADTGAAHLIALNPAPVTALSAYYHADENTWTVPGTSIVLDYSGNGNHGDTISIGGGSPVYTAGTAAAIAGDPGTCGYGVFPLNTSQTEQQAVDSRLIPGDTGSVTFWYRSDSAWVGSGDLKLLDASKDANNRFFLTKMNDGTLRFRLEVGGVASQADTAVQSFSANTWVHIGITWDLVNNKTEIYINGTLSATSTAAVGTGSAWDTLYLGDNRANLGGQGNTGNSAGGSIDEVRIYAGVIGQTTVDQDRILVHGCSQVDHYSISFPNGSSGTCAPTMVEITARDILDAPINVFSGTVMYLSTQSGAGFWGSLVAGSGTWSPSGANDGLATYIWPGGESTVQVDLSHTTTVTENINVDDGTASEPAGDPVEDPNIDFSSTPIIRITPDGTAVGGVNTQIAAKDSSQAPGQTMYIQLKQSGVTRFRQDACEVPGAYSGNLTVQIAAECLDPVSCAGQQVTVQNNTGTPIAVNTYNSGSVPASTAAWTSVTMNFDGNGRNTNDNKASLVINYPDAGLVKLHFETTLNPRGRGTPRLTFTGTSDAFVVRPFGFRIDNFNPANPAAVDQNGGIFTKAGANFSADITAVAWQAGDDANLDGVPDSNAVLSNNAVTPNFGNEISPATINLSHTLVAPSGAGASSGTLTGGGISSGFSNGLLAGKTMSWDEVGIIQLNVNEGSGDYLGGGQDITGVIPYLGRFTPANLTVAIQGSTSFANACTAGTTPFTYQDQAFYYGPAASNAPTLRIRGVDTNGNVTKNYDSNEFFKLSTTLPRNYTDQAGAAANLQPPIIDTTVSVLDLNNYNGYVDLRLDSGTNGDAFMYSRVTPEAPFPASVLLTFTGAGLIDSDGICYDGNGDGICEGTINNNDDFAYGTIGGVELRFGRLVIGEEVSSEVIDMNVPVTAEYFNGTGYVTNQDDQCTGIASTDLSLSNTLQSAQTDGNIQICEAGGTTNMTVGSNPFAAGVGMLTFTAPGASCEGFTNIDVNLSTLGLDYLRFDWQDADGLNNGPYTDDPTGRATFGILSRPKDIIYTREPWK